VLPMGHDGTCADAMHDALAPARAIEDAERKVVEAAERLASATKKVTEAHMLGQPSGLHANALKREIEQSVAEVEATVTALHAARQGVQHGE